MRKLMFVLTCVVAAAGCGKKDDGTYDKDRYDSKRTTTEQRDADNTGVNERDRSGATATPVDQKENKADIDRTAEIRKRVVDAKLSTDAKNVKIVTQNGRVTLRGPVNTQAEKDTIDRIAVDVAGAGNVDDQLEVVIVR